MKPSTKTAIDVVVFGICMFFAGIVLGYLVHVPTSCPPDMSYSLKGCELTAADVEKELEETRWHLSRCANILEDMLGRYGLPQ